MKSMKLSVRICQFPYSGNGSSSSTHPDVGDWIVKAVLAAQKDERICNIDNERYSDTPITMTRNKAVTDARKAGIDVLIMVDSDQAPDYMIGKDPTAQPFFESSFDYLYKHWNKGPVAIASPYCGPPPNEGVYGFVWENRMNDLPQDTPNMALRMYTRNEATQMSGIQDAGAFATGLSMYDMRCFNLTDPQTELDRLIKKYGLTNDEAMQRVHPWFYYEWDSVFHDNKGSTEDVTFSRDLSLIGRSKLGYNPVKINWSAWAGHWKPKMVCKPQPLTLDDINEKYQLALDSGMSRYDRQIQADFPLPPAEQYAQLRREELCHPNVSITEPIHAGNGAHY